MSVWPFESPGTRFDASLLNTAVRPSAEMRTPSLIPFACPPPGATLIRVVVAFVRSRRKTSVASFVSPGTSVLEPLENTTQRPSSETSPSSEPRSPCVPFVWMLTRSRSPVERSIRNVSDRKFVSPGTRFDASLENTMKRASPDNVAR
jgi:hypothetical protein